MSGHLFGAALIIVVTLAVFWLGWHSHGLYTDERAILPKHSHRKGAPQESGPRPTALLQPPRLEGTDVYGNQWTGHAPAVSAPWHFAGESEQGWAAESAEYELLTQTAELPEVVPGVDSPSDFELSMTERVNAMIAVYEGDTNEWIHSMPRVAVDG